MIREGHEFTRAGKPPTLCHSDPASAGRNLLFLTFVNRGSCTLYLLPARVHRLAQARVARQSGGLVCRFPREIGIAAAKVSVCRSLAVDRPAQLERVDNPFGRQFEVRP